MNLANPLALIAARIFALSTVLQQRLRRKTQAHKIPRWNEATRQAGLPEQERCPSPNGGHRPGRPRLLRDAPA